MAKDLRGREPNKRMMRFAKLLTHEVKWVRIFGRHFKNNREYSLLGVSNIGKSPMRTTLSIKVDALTIHIISQCEICDDQSYMDSFYLRVISPKQITLSPYLCFESIDQIIAKIEDERKNNSS